MLNCQSILCPVDLAPEGDQALRYAAALSRAFGAKLYVLHCAEFIGPGAPRGVETIFRQNIARQMHRIRALTADYETLIDSAGWNDPAEYIVSEANARQISLIVMQSRRGPRAAALLGSTSETVCRTAPCPVLVTHPQEHEFITGAEDAISLRRVLIADDFSGHAARAVSWGLALAQEYRAQTHLLHVLAPQEYSALTDNFEAHRIARDKLRRQAPEEISLWCPVELAVRYGKPEEEINSYARLHEIDLMCIGSHGSGRGWREWLGTTADQILRHAPCPTLVARPVTNV